MEIMIAGMSLRSVNKIYSDTNAESHLCKEISAQDGKYYIVNFIKNKVLIDEYLPIIIHDLKERLTAVFVECVNIDGYLYTVLRHNDEHTLDICLKQYNFNILDRIYIVKELIKRLIESDTSNAMKYNLLNSVNINLSEDKKIYFNYYIGDVISPDNIDMRVVGNRLCKVIRELLVADNKNKVISKRIDKALSLIENSRYKNEIFIYNKIKELEKFIKEELQRDHKTLIHKILEMFAKFIKVVIPIAIVVVLFYYVYVQAAAFINQTQTGTAINVIGTTSLNEKAYKNK